MRQIILDTETTGLEAAQNHRIIEIGCVELIGRRPTGRHFHRYLNPERDIDEGALAVARDHPAQGYRTGAQVRPDRGGADRVPARCRIGHSTMRPSMWVSWMPSVARLAQERVTVAALCSVVDSLALARQMHPGQRNGLDALCKRYNVDNSGRQLHGALLDAQLLGEVYLAMTGGQVALRLGETGSSRGDEAALARPLVRPAVPLRVITAHGRGGKCPCGLSRSHWQVQQGAVSVAADRRGGRRRLLCEGGASRLDLCTELSRR